jgi:hypothetical protein
MKSPRLGLRWWARFGGVRHACAWLLSVAWVGSALAQPTTVAPGLPSLAEMEAAGATIGQIRILALDIFDLSDPREDRVLFRLANAFHIQTRPGVIERALLFKSGEPLSVRRLEETERLLRSNRYLYDVQFRAAAYVGGVVDIDVVTRDTWSLEPGASVGRAGGANSSGVHLTEHNLLGSGISLSLGRSKNVDRSSNEFQFSSDRAFGSGVSLALSHASNSDGTRSAASAAQPFYALDTRWAAGVSAVKDDRLDAVYNAGNISSQYRHRLSLGEAFVGWSTGLVAGWVKRYSVGVSYQDDRYALAPGLTAPPQLPQDEKRVAPFVRLALIEDHFDRELNRNLIGRPEFFALGLVATVQLGWASTGLGSSLNALLYSASVSRGFEAHPEQTLIVAASVSGQSANGEVRHQRLGAQAKFYLRHSPTWLLYASAAADMLTRADPAEALLLGGDNGLRGYPLRYQSGTRRALFTVEERYYTDLYIWRLFRIGGAAFVDMGRAWGGDAPNLGNPGWLSNAGLGLRIVSARSAFSNVLHVDLAFPLNTTASIKKTQLLVKSRTSF